MDLIKTILGKNAIPVHGEFHATGSTGGELSLYNREGAAYTYVDDDRVVVTYARLVVTAAGAAAIHWNLDGDDDLDDGDAIIRWVAAAGVLQQDLDLTSDPICGPKVNSAATDSGKPRAICASGGVDAWIKAYILKP